MGVIGAVIIFVGLIFVLSLLRTRLVFEFSATSLLLLGTRKPGILLYSLLVLPGTILHELSHWLMAEILQVRTGEIVILPELTGGSEERLGSVATAHSDPFRGFLIGIAPFITGISALLALGQLLLILWSNSSPWWQLALAVYAIMVLGNSMLISRADRRTWPFMLSLVVLLSFLVLYFKLAPSAQVLLFATANLGSLNLVLGMTAGVNLVMIGGSYIIRQGVEKITRRKIQ